MKIAFFFMAAFFSCGIFTSSFDNDYFQQQSDESEYLRQISEELNECELNKNCTIEYRNLYALRSPCKQEFYTLAWNSGKIIEIIKASCQESSIFGGGANYDVKICEPDEECVNFNESNYLTECRPIINGIEEKYWDNYFKERDERIKLRRKETKHLKKAEKKAKKEARKNKFKN